MQDLTNDGVVTVNSGGTLNNAVSDIVCGGGSRTTINPGGQLNANSDGSGSGLDLNGALLVNNGTVTGPRTSITARWPRAPARTVP